ncbi:MAG: putative peptide zinc metalloprotease protein [Sulfurimonas sp.]|jgi:putative peptide zinc metalloprotease protein|uniref:site-2 protease family protein n=1 Tax=Sulfurimonas sp. TaxID=2022749 RepID=UPI0039E452D6
MVGNIFSELWHRVSDLEVSLIYNATIEKQLYRGRVWYVIREPYNNKYFRVTPKAYKFLNRLTVKRSINEIWEEYLEHNPEEAPTQDEVIKILTQLHQSNLLYFKNMPNNEHIFNRHVRKQHVELRNKFVSFLYLKVPLWDPQKWLIRYDWLVRLLINKVTLIVWLMVILFGLKIFADNFYSFSIQGEGFLAPSNMLLLYISLFVLKFFHEMGHAMMVRKFGGDVHTLGIMFIVFTPLPYMDASNSWLFKNKWHKILVSSAGVIVELFFAAIAAVVWVNTGDGIIHSIAFNVMVVGSVSSLIFNGNPLLKFDAYYVLSDFLEIPNLQTKSGNVWVYWWQKYFFDVASIKKAYDTKKESILLAAYGILSYFYRLLVAVSIALFVSDQWIEVGILIVIVSSYIWIFKPISKFVKYLIHDDALIGKRKKAYTITFSILGLIVFSVGYIPVSSYIYAKGVVQSREHSNVFSKTEGYLTTVYFNDGERVKKDDLLVTFKNPELSIEIVGIKAKIQEARLMLLKSRNESIADIKNLSEQMKVLNDNLLFLEEKKTNLNIYASNNGMWVSNNLGNYLGTYIKIGDKIGEILPIQKFDFVAVVSQEDSSDLFGIILNSEIKLYSDIRKTLATKELNIIPYETYELPSPSLGWQGGGDIMTNQEDRNGVRTIEAYFKVIATLDESDIFFLYNERGVLRLKVPDKTLIESAVESVKKLLQKRYKI